MQFIVHGVVSSHIAHNTWEIHRLELLVTGFLTLLLFIVVWEANLLIEVRARAETWGAVALGHLKFRVQRLGKVVHSTWL